ncbi:heat shock factor-binding protein 1-like [Cryptosporidium felis]|nr:heat shock factor-binding protein 1-like [Cryptosporidium felis]
MDSTPNNLENDYSQETAAPNVSIEDPTNSLKNVMQDVQEHFQMMSQTILNRIDDMGSRIDQLEFMVNDLLAEIESSSPLKEQSLGQNTNKLDNNLQNPKHGKEVDANYPNGYPAQC